MSFPPIQIRENMIMSTVQVVDSGNISTVKIKAVMVYVITSLQRSFNCFTSQVTKYILYRGFARVLSSLCR